MTATDAGAGARFVGQRVARREDARLVTGHGRYVDDEIVPGLLHVAFVRSHVARGRIRHLDVSAARELEGVQAVYTAADLNPLAHDMWCTMLGPPSAGAAYPPLRPLADGDVRFVGDPVAVVVADTRYVAEDACELVELDIDPEPAVLDVRAALGEGADLVHPELGSNLAQPMPARPDPAVDEAFATAAHVVTRTFRQCRQTNVPMETRGLIVSWDPYGQHLRIWSSTQNPFEIRAYAARLLGINEALIRVTMGDVGGGFGQKVVVSRDETNVILTGYKLGRPVKWIEDRRENLIAANQAREELVTVSFATDDEGHILAARVEHVEDVGAYPMGGSGAIGGFSAMMFTGPYRIPLLSYAATAVWTNTVGKAPYRGPWMIETVVREQMMDHVARDLGIDPLELRRRNVIHAEDLPYSTASGMVYDIVTPSETLEQAAAMLDYDAFRTEQRRARDDGRYLGVGVSVYIEPSAVAYGLLSTDHAIMRIEGSGKVFVTMNTASHGQSLETTIPQVVADHLGCALDDVVFLQGDTALTTFGHGTGGSRSAVISGGAARQAAIMMREKVLALAAHLLEAAREDLDVHDSVVSVRGTPTKTLHFAQIAPAAYVPEIRPPGIENGLEVSLRYSPPAPFTWSNAAHICTCEIDVETGMVGLLRYIVSEDCGVMINPTVVEGQIAGGVVQGIGGVLHEYLPYDPDGNPLATTLMDYLLPTASDVPVIEYGHVETPSNTPGGHKGMGEGGAIASPAAVANAIADALTPFGALVTEFPLGPSQVIDLLRGR
jgi:carbon-monoxide dehydrogenase large subunit